MRVKLCKSDAIVCGKYLIFRDDYPNFSPGVSYYILVSLHKQEVFGRAELGCLSHFTVRNGKVVKNMYPKQGIPPGMREAVDLVTALSVMDV